MGLQMPDILDKVEKVIPFRKFVDKSANAEILPYAYPCENYISIVVSNPASKYALKKFFDSKIKEEIEAIIRESVEITQRSFPRVYSLFKDCCNKLGIHDSIMIAISTRLRGANSITVGTNEKPVILLSPSAVSRLKNAELSFLIGHELGHIAQKNLICHTVKGALDAFNKWSDALGPIAADMIEVPLNKWYRCSEFTSDRAGLICCGNIRSALSVFDKFSCYKTSTNFIFDSYKELACDHPTISNRIMELTRFYQEQFNIV